MNAFQQFQIPVQVHLGFNRSNDFLCNQTALLSLCLQRVFGEVIMPQWARTEHCPAESTSRYVNLQDLLKAVDCFVMNTELHLTFLITPIKRDFLVDWQLFYDLHTHLPVCRLASMAEWGASFAP